MENTTTNKILKDFHAFLEKTEAFGGPITFWEAIQNLHHDCGDLMRCSDSRIKYGMLFTEGYFDAAKFRKDKNADS